MTGSDNSYNYQGVTGDARFFAEGEIVIATWYNNSEDTVTFTPKISFDDPDRRTMGVAGTWHDMGGVTIPAGGTGLSLFEFDIPSQGTYALVNVNVNYSNNEVLICDRISLIMNEDTEPPAVPENISGIPVSESGSRVCWDESSDNRAVTAYELFRGGVSVGTVTETCHEDTGLSPLTEYVCNVGACDAAGNCSEKSAEISVTTPDEVFEISISVSGCDDDAREQTADGSVDMTDVLLRMGADGNYPVGIRFADTGIPQGAVISEVYIEFETGDPHASATTRSRNARVAAPGPNDASAAFVITAESSGNAAVFSSDPYDISGRSLSSVSLPWDISSPWTTGEKYRTPDIAPLLQEIADRQDWNSGNAVAFVISGMGQRYVKSCDAGEPSAAPMLRVRYFVEGGLRLADNDNFKAGNIITSSAFESISCLVAADDGYLYVGDYGKKGIFRVDRTSREVTQIDTKGFSIRQPDQMLIGNGHPQTGHDLIVSDHNSSGAGSSCCDGQVFRINRETGDIKVISKGNPVTLGDPYGLALGPGGDFGTDLYIMDFQGAYWLTPVLFRVRGDGTQEYLAGGYPYVNNIAFDTSGLFGGDLFVSSYRGTYIWRITPAFETSTFITKNSSLFKGVADIRFGLGGEFGQDMYVLSGLDGTVYRISPDGVISSFVSGLTPVESYLHTAMTFSLDGKIMFIGIRDSIIEINPLLDNQPPAASFEVGGSGVPLEVVIFDGKNSWDMDGTIVSHVWDFGDGATKEGSYAPHIFQEEGDYLVCLTVTDDGGAAHRLGRVIKITDNHPPLIRLGVSGDFSKNKEIIFSAIGTDDPEGGNLVYEWDFGDGQKVSGAEDEISHIYTEAGNYRFVLCVTDEEGAFNETVRILTIMPAQGPVAVFTAGGAFAGGETVVFDASGSYSQDGGTIADYAWNFGDGHVAGGTDAEISHVYTVTGNHTVSLFVTDSAGQTSPASSLTLNIIANQPPRAAFGYSGQMAAGAEITFDASASHDPEGHDLTYAWDFDGDGQNDDTGAAVSHVFQAVTLTVTDDRGQTAVSERTFRITSPSQITAAFSVSGAPLTGREMSFDAGASVSSAGSIVSREWDFGDGNTGEGVQTVHVWTQPDQYAVTLRVTDDTGAYAESVYLLTVGFEANENPALTQMVCPARGPVNEAVPFSAAASDPNADSLAYVWDFGEGSTAEGSSPTHTYTDVGAYDVSVTVTDGRGGSAAATAHIVISERPAENVPPEAAAGGPYQGVIGEPATFDGSLSYDMNADILTYSWDFGGISAVAAHTFMTPGTHEVTLTVTDTAGLTGTDTAVVRIADPDDTAPPSVTLDLNCPDIYDLYPVTGSVSDDSGSVRYELRTRERGAPRTGSLSRRGTVRPFPANWACSTPRC